ncbi:hypothetical protein ACJZ2D_014281 [Fusarium nematophilum]
MYRQKSFLDLPPELRHMVYKYCLATPGGYIFNWETKKLRTANKEPIYLALSLTCRQIAGEMHGMALSVNKITFSTFYSDESRLRAGQFHWYVSSLLWAENKFLHTASHLLTWDIYEDVARKYPLFMPMMDHVLDRCKPRPGSSRYIHREAMAYCVRLMATRGQSIREDDLDEGIGGCDVTREERVKEETKWCEYKPWAIPDDEYLEDTRELWMRGGRGPLVVDPAKSLADSRQKYRLSAAAGAISFLRSLPASMRSHVTQMVLHEDREAVGMPECHGQGLIPFCRENPRLRIERRVNLWRNVFQQKQTQLIKRFGDHYWESTEQIQAFQIAGPVISWIAEALALVQAGMPRDVFSLVLDGNPSPDACAEIFQAVVQRYIAWNIALRESVSRERITELGFRGCLQINTDDVEEAEECLEALIDDDSLIRCNFFPGKPWDVEEVIESHAGWPLEKWDYKWQDYEPRVYKTPPELPRWIDLLLEDVLPPEDEEELVGMQSFVEDESLIDEESLIGREGFI